MQVRTTPDGTVVIEGKHEERSSPATPMDSGSGVRNYNAVQQQFSRQFTLPQGCEPMRVVSNLSRDGVLIVTAPKKASSGGASSPYSSSASPYASSASSPYAYAQSQNRAPRPSPCSSSSCQRTNVSTCLFSIDFNMRQVAVL